MKGNGPTLLGREWLNTLKDDCNCLNSYSLQTLPSCYKEKELSDQILAQFPEVFDVKLGTLKVKPDTHRETTRQR